ncbi:MAG: DUF6502 family protein [Pseudomonadota bacterium]
MEVELDKAAGLGKGIGHTVTSVIDSTSFIQAILRALVRWCLKRGVRSAQVEELVRRTFVVEARREIKAAQSEFSVSKVSVMTGLHRTEVSRLLAEEGEPPAQHDILNRVIGLWSSAKRYRAKDGSPRGLTHEGLGSEFAELVADVSKEVTHYPILFELERIGAIEYREGTVNLVVKGYTPQQDAQYGLDLLTLDLMDLASAIESNIVKRHTEPSLHLRTSFDNIDPAKLDEVRAWLISKGADFQSEVRCYLASLDRDLDGQGINSDNDRATVSVTSFAYAERVEPVKKITPRKRGRKRCAP